MITFILNNELIKTDLPTGFVLLDFIRKNQRLTGTKEGCREGDCGACTVLVGELINDEIKYKTVNSCLFPLGDAHLKHIVTIEGLNLENPNYLQDKFVELGGTQCGFCTPGFIVSSLGYFITQRDYKLDDAIQFVAGNICRCTGYAGIKRALNSTIEFLNSSIKRTNGKEKSIINELIKIKLIPEYFASIPEKLKSLQFEEEKSSRTESNIFVSGGTDLYVQKWDELVEKDVILISSKNQLKGVELIGEEIFIGGATTISEVEESDLIQLIIPELKDFLKLFGSKPIRNRATVAGNIVNASPIGDFTNILLALNADIHLSNGNEKRTVPLKKFFLAYKQLDKKEDELIQSISFKKPDKGYLFNFEKISRRTYLDIASVNSTFFGYVENGIFKEVSFTAGGVAPIPLFLKETSSFLKNKEINLGTIEQSVEIALKEISPISDARGSAEYKTLLLRQLLLAHFEKFFPELITEDFILREER
ncbi:MAG: FAD binding domain-containing protein [Ignavibacteria bacterium]